MLTRGPIAPNPEGSAVSAARSAGATAACIVAALALAAAVRLPRVLADEFPINDGGVFFVMIGEIAGGSLALPPATSYNEASIPMAYPPLAICAAAAIHRSTGLPALTLLRVIPVTVNLATVVALFFLARSLLGATWLAALAAMAFAVLPRSYEFMIMGGGLPRSFGFLFACVAVTFAHRLAVERRAWPGVTAAIALGLAILSHPEMGLWAAASVALVAASRGLDRWTLAAVAAVGAGAAAVAAPWLAVTLARHGVEPFLAASQSSGWGARSVLGLLSRWVVGETGLAPLTILAFAGALEATVRRRFLLPAWLVLGFVVVPRSAPTPATVPLALLAASAMANVVLPLLERLLARRRAAPGGPPAVAGPDGPARPRPFLAMALMAPAIAYTMVFSNLRRSPDEWPSMRRVPPAEREAMAWVAANVAEGERFAVVSGIGSWWVDPVDAWFPALTGRESVATPNGAEWLAGGEFARRVLAHRALQGCHDADCLARWAERFEMRFSHVYVSRRPTAARAAPSVAAVPGDAFTVIYDGPGAAVLARRVPSATEASPAVSGPGAVSDRAH